jgi:hypothetical protein
MIQTPIYHHRATTTITILLNHELQSSTTIYRSSFITFTEPKHNTWRIHTKSFQVSTINLVSKHSIWWHITELQRSSDIPSGIFSSIGCWLIIEPWVVGLVLVVVNILVFGSLYSYYSHKRIWYISLLIILMMFLNLSMFVMLVIDWLLYDI